MIFRLIINCEWIQPLLFIKYCVRLHFMCVRIFLAVLSLFIFSIAHAEDMLKLDVVTEGGSGTVLIKLLPDVAPKHVERIKQLTREGAYNNMVFHRVISGFMAQTGDVAHGNRDNYDDTRVGKGGSQYKDLYAELSELPFKAGIVGMARNRYIHSANSQFFIMTASHPNLNGRYTVVGVVTKGIDIVRQLKSGSQGGQGKVDEPDYIRSASIIDG